MRTHPPFFQFGFSPFDFFPLRILEYYYVISTFLPLPTHLQLPPVSALSSTTSCPFLPGFQTPIPLPKTKETRVQNKGAALYPASHRHRSNLMCLKPRHLKYLTISQAGDCQRCQADSNM